MHQTRAIESRIDDPTEGFPAFYHAGLIPERTTDPRRAFHLWSSDGAVILTTHRTDTAAMLGGLPLP
jgi:hypothetical protein